MPIERTIDLLNKLKNVHKDLAECYSGQKTEERKDKVQVMLSYLKDQEERLASAMDEYKGVTHAESLSTYYSKSPDKDKWEFLASCRINKDVSFEELVQEVLKTSEAYIEILQEIHDLSETKDHSAIFKDLLNGAIHSRNQFMYNTLMLGDG